MSKQLDLFDRFTAKLTQTDYTAPRARRSDDATSHEAARNHRIKAGSNCEIILNFVVQNPGFTSAEIGVEVGLGRHEAGRRLADLFKAGYVRKGPVRKCSTNGNNMVTWEAI